MIDRRTRLRAQLKSTARRLLVSTPMLQQTGPAVGRAFNNRDLATGLSIHVSLLEGPVLQNVKYWHFLSCKCTNKINKSQCHQKFTLFSRKFSRHCACLCICVFDILYRYQCSQPLTETPKRGQQQFSGDLNYEAGCYVAEGVCKKQSHEENGAKQQGFCRSFALTSPLICVFACLVLNPPLFYSARPMCIGSRGPSECFTL